MIAATSLASQFDPARERRWQQLLADAIEAGVLPYYLHLLDKVRGAAHFDVDQARASGLYEALTASLPGYLVPRLVREVAGAAAKTPVRAREREC